MSVHTTSAGSLWRREADLLLAACTPEQRDSLRANPLAALLRWDGIAAELRPEVRSPGLCNTDGYYDPDADPPRILVAASASVPGGEVGQRPATVR